MLWRAERRVRFCYKRRAICLNDPHQNLSEFLLILFNSICLIWYTVTIQSYLSKPKESKCQSQPLKSAHSQSFFISLILFIAPSSSFGAGWATVVADDSNGSYIDKCDSDASCSESDNVKIGANQEKTTSNNYIILLGIIVILMVIAYSYLGVQEIIKRRRAKRPSQID